jgi:predicted glycoside hydrolase/deacetylase ChbG (UPF0249 family)
MTVERALVSPIEEEHINLDALTQILLSLTPAELETLEIMLTPGLVDELLERAESAEAGNTVSLEEARAELLDRD